MAAALITGVSRRRGIAAAVADRLRTDASEAMRLIAAAENKAGPLSALVLAHTPTAVVGCSK
jgi:hypothetical protein